MLRLMAPSSYNYSMQGTPSVAKKNGAKTLLLAVCACAFFGVLATFDLSEQHRAWRTAETWTDTQRQVAQAQDAGSVQPLILAALVTNTLVVSLSFACLLTLGIAVASDEQRTFSLARILVWTVLGLGLLLSVLALAYRLKVGDRTILKGPIYDYNLRFQPPLVFAAIGYPLVCILYLMDRRR